MAALPDVDELGVIEVDEGRWRALSTRLRRHGHGWYAVPLDDGRRLVVTDGVGGADAMPFAAACARAEEALQACTRGGVDGHTSMAKSWRDRMNATLAEWDADDELEVDEPEVEYLGVLTGARRGVETVMAEARRLGGRAVPVAPLSVDVDVVQRHRIVGLDGDALVALWERLGLVGWDALAQHRAERRTGEAMVREMRRRWRRDDERRVA
jgi:hypothetical protein